MKKVLLLLALVQLSSCAVKLTPVSLERKNYDNVPIGKELENEIGESLVVKGQEDTQDAVKIRKLKDFSMSLEKFAYEDGEVLPLSATHKGWNLYYKNKNTQSIQGIAIGQDHTDWYRVFSSNMNGFTLKTIEGKVEIEKTSYANPDCRDCYKQELVYNGKSGNTVKLMYREYVNNMARPAFSQDLQYDLSDSNVIGIKGLRIEVLKATNTRIKYKVIKSFDDLF